MAAWAEARRMVHAVDGFDDLLRNFPVRHRSDLFQVVIYTIHSAEHPVHPVILSKTPHPMTTLPIAAAKPEVPYAPP